MASKIFNLTCKLIIQTKFVHWNSICWLKSQALTVVKNWRICFDDNNFVRQKILADFSFTKDWPWLCWGAAVIRWHRNFPLSWLLPYEDWLERQPLYIECIFKWVWPFLRMWNIQTCLRIWLKNYLENMSLCFVFSLVLIHFIDLIVNYIFIIPNGIALGSTKHPFNFLPSFHPSPSVSGIVTFGGLPFFERLYVSVWW